MRFLLINVPIREDAVPSNFPTGLGIIAQVLVDNGYEVEILDINARRYKPEEVIPLIEAAGADVIGISGLVSTFKYQHWLVDGIKESLPNTKIIAGGGCATSVPELMLEHMAVDVLVIGEGEETIVELARALESGDSMDRIRGLAYRVDGDIFKTEPRPLIEDLDELPLPAYHLFPTEIYIGNPQWLFEDKALNIISSRGCPMDCHFCYNLFGKRSYRKRGVASVVEEIRLLKREYGITSVGFVDDNLTINKKHLKEICEKLAPENVRWGCHGRVDTLDDERLSWMASSGCKWLGFGIESGSQRMLERMNKRITVEQASKAIQMTRDHGIFANTTFIYGYPGEDETSARETMKFRIENDLLCDAFYATPYPGTELYRIALEQGAIGDEYEYVMSLNNAYDYKLNLTDMPREQFDRFKKAIYTEVEHALAFKLTDTNEENETAYLSAASQFLEGEVVYPEAKGAVLLGIARYFDSNGQRLKAIQARSVAKSFGMVWDSPPKEGLEVGAQAK